MKEKNIIKFISFGPILFIPAIVIVLVLVIAKANSDHFNLNIQKLESNAIALKEESIKSRIDAYVSHISFKKSLIKKNLLERVKNRVNHAYSIAIGIHNRYKDEKTDTEIKEMIVTSLRNLIWNNGESFIWLVDYNGVAYLQPKYLRHLEGNSIINFQDANGQYVVKEEIKICKEKGEGYLWDTFTKSDTGSTKQYKQVGFVKDLGYYNLYLGSAEYLEMAEKTSDNALLTSLTQIDSLSSHYIFIMKDNGDIILHDKQPFLVGKNIYELDDDKLKSVFEHIINSVKDKNNSFASYGWRNKQTDKFETKVSYIRKVPNSDWIVGSGYQVLDIKHKAAELSLDLHDSYYMKLKGLLLTSFVLILISLIISYIISQYIKKSFLGYKAQINAKNIELFGMNETLEERVIHRTQELHDATEKLEMLATTDSLTNINNRYSIMKMLDLEITRARRYNEALSIFMYDVDYFKRVNDTYGHHVGDETLYALTKLVQSCLRDIDIVGRYGGEEFLVIMPSTRLFHAVEVTNRIRKEVANHKFQNIEQLTISIGLVELNSSETMDMLFARVDTLLYKSKNNGRNRVSF